MLTKKKKQKKDPRKFLLFLENLVSDSQLSLNLQSVLKESQQFLEAKISSGEEEKLFIKLVGVILADFPGFINNQDAIGFTILHWGCFLGYATLVELVLGKGAAMLEDIHGVPPLAYAEKGGYDNIVNMLLEPRNSNYLLLNIFFFFFFHIFIYLLKKKK